MQLWFVRCVADQGTFAKLGIKIFRMDTNSDNLLTTNLCVEKMVPGNRA